jgi:HEAT repeat protein
MAEGMPAIMSIPAIRRDLTSQDAETLAQGLRRLALMLGTDAVTNLPPPDYAERKAALGPLESRLLELSHHGDEAVRELAADCLAAWLGEPALARLLELTQDSVERVRASAVGAMDQFAHSDAAREVLLGAVDAPQWTVRMRAARALWPFAGLEVEDALFDALLDPDSYVRMNAAESLKRRDPASLLVRLRSLHDHPAPHMLDSAMDLLGAIGTLEDAKFLEKAGSWLNLSQPAFVRAWSRKAAQDIRQRLASKPA